MADNQQAQLFGSHFFDYGLPGALDDPSLLFLDEYGRPIDMTQLQVFDPGYHGSADMIFDSQQTSEQTYQTTVEGGQSLSPDDASALITSSSNFNPYIADLNNSGSDPASCSSQSVSSIAKDYVRVHSPKTRPHGQRPAMDKQATRSLPMSTPSSQVSSQSQDSVGLCLLTGQAMSSQQWQQSISEPTNGVLGDLVGPANYSDCAGSGDFGFIEDAALMGVGSSNFTSAFSMAQQQQQPPNHSNLPSQSYDGAQTQPPVQASTLATIQYMNNLDIYSHQWFSPCLSVNANTMQSNSTPTYDLNAENIGHTGRQASTLALRVPQVVTPTQPNNPNSPSQGSQNLRLLTARTHSQACSRIEMRTAPAISGGNNPTGSPQSGFLSQYQSFDINGAYPAIFAGPIRQQLGTPHIAAAERISKGGRKKNSHLPDQSRQRSHAMRKVGACWRCVIQRDPCDAPDGGCCSRCNMRAVRGQAYFFDCDRSKLPEFVAEFLPASLLYDHQKRGIETFVSKEVVNWHMENCIDVYLSSGYGPPLPWKLYEFTPRNHESLYQLQFVQDPQSKKTIVISKYSPPYGLLKIDRVDDRNYEAYLDDLLHPQWLQELGESFYAEENTVDNDNFQCKVLDHICNLYVNTQDATLKPLLKDVLRMIVISYIMGHTLTITQDTLYPVINNIRHSHRPPVYQKHTSPRLANRQLKFFFNGVRNGIYEKILRWQQHTLHTAGKKQETWMHAFCVTLGFAMVLEEVQRTIICQAEAKVCRDEATPQAAYDEARQLCGNIDSRFKLLVGLFQCKYRDRKWTGHGSFGNGTPKFHDPIYNHFLANVRLLVERREPHLRSRENVQFSLENQGLYTTRLTARFLLPFLNLPST